MIHQEIPIKGARVLVLGLAFKENCSDIRNTKVAELISDLASYGMQIDVYDPWVNPTQAQQKYGINLLEKHQLGQYQVIVLAVAHGEFKTLEPELPNLQTANSLVFDIKNFFAK